MPYRELLKQAASCRARAKVMRTIADSTPHFELRKTILQIAEDYEKMARDLDERVKKLSTPKK